MIDLSLHDECCRCVNGLLTTNAATVPRSMRGAYMPPIGDTARVHDQHRTGRQLIMVATARFRQL